jgi:hypothetical protein
MGYSGLENWARVDGAADLRANLLASKGTRKFSAFIKEAMEDEGNAFNPNGFVNLALILESGDITPKELGKRTLFPILDNLISLLEEENDDYHDKAYLRLYHVVRKALRGS